MDFESVKLTTNMLYKCRTFAEQVYESNRDKLIERGQSNRDKAVRQNTYGKLAELATESYLKDIGVEILCAPDFTVYDAKLKRYGADLRVILNERAASVAVKACDAVDARTRGLSWMFTYRQNGYDTDDLFFKPQGYLSCVCVDMERLEAAIFGIPQVTAELMSGIAERGIPLVSELRDFKRVLYVRELSKFDWRTRWHLVAGTMSFPAPVTTASHASHP